MKELPKTYFAFEVDIEKMEGKFILDTGKYNQMEAEQVMLEKCDYKYIIHGIAADGDVYGGTILDSSDILGISQKGAIMALGDTVTTVLRTENGFICQMCPDFWWKEVLYGEPMYVMTVNAEYPLKLINTPFDV